MKKAIAVLILLCFLLLTACQGEVPTVADEWGVTLSATNVTSEGMTLVMEQKGDLEGELQTGSAFIIEKNTDGEWAEIPTLGEEPIVWTAIAYLVPQNTATELETNWTFVYGALEQGSYRLVKTLALRRSPGDYDEKTYYAEFVVE